MAVHRGVCRGYAYDSLRRKKISPNTGFVSWTGNSLSSTPILTFAHEVGHNLGAEHDGDGNHCDPNHYMMASTSQPYTRDHSKIFSSCSKNYFEKELQSMVQVQ